MFTKAFIYLIGVITKLKAFKNCNDLKIGMKLNLTIIVPQEKKKGQKYLHYKLSQSN